MKPGKTILHYKILEKLGEGGMGVVYKAEDLKLKRIVALKFLPTHLMSRPRFRIRLEREAQAASSLNHPNICPVYAYHETDDSIFRVMEYIEGETLKEMIERKGPIPLEKAIEIITQVAEALAVAHQNGIIHRDIKSDNIMITKDGQVKVMDFGLAKLKDAPTITKSGFPIGTVAYMSPELVQGKEVDHRTDLWSLGVVLFEMITGELPFKGDSDVGVMYSIVGDEPATITKYKLDIDFSVQYIISKLLDKKSGYRYQSADQLLNDLNRKIRISLTKFILKKYRKHYKRTAIGILTTIMLIFILYYYYQIEIKKSVWLKSSAKIIQLTDEIGHERGRISPNGKYVVYHGADALLHIKNLSTKDDKKIREGESGTFHFPIWSPKSDRIAYISSEMNGISIVDLEGTECQEIVKHFQGNIFHLDWSPDGEWILYEFEEFVENSLAASLIIIKTDGSESRLLFKRNPSIGSYQTAWHPDGDRFAFFDRNPDTKSKVIRIFNLSDGSVSKPIIELQDKTGSWLRGGMTYSPNCKFLIYPELVNDRIEIVALKLIENGKKTSGTPIQLTNLAGNGVPYWPCITKDNRMISYCVSQSTSNFYIASSDLVNLRLADKVTQISNKRSVDEFACWSPDGMNIAFTSDRDGQKDIYLWNKLNRQTKRLTFTKEAEFQLTFLPDGSEISYISEGQLFSISMNGEQNNKIFPKSTMKKLFTTYAFQSYAWAKDSRILYALIPETYGGTEGRLVKVDLQTEKIEYLSNQTFYLPYAELRGSPSKELLALRALLHASSDNSTIEIYNIPLKNDKILIEHDPRLAGQISWAGSDSLIVYNTWEDSERVYSTYLVNVFDNAKFFLSHRPNSMAEHPGQVSPNGSEMIIYSKSEESDIWGVGEI